jgi:hypothetical protein
MQRQADPVIRTQMRSRVPEFLRSISADVEWKKLVAIYDRLSGSEPCRKRDDPLKGLVRAAQ